MYVRRGSAILRPYCGGQCKHRATTGYKNQFNLELGRVPQVSEIKLIRTDTTLDLSQKAEKVMKLHDGTGFQQNLLA